MKCVIDHIGSFADKPGRIARIHDEDARALVKAGKATFTRKIDWKAQKAADSLEKR